MNDKNTSQHDRTEKAAAMFAPNDVRIEQVPKVPLGENQVRVAVKACGICTSDLHYYLHGRIGDFVVTKPLILGHECAGEVVEVGPQVKGLKVGDRVAVEPGVPCGKCTYCRQGRYNLCPEVVFFATPPVDGAFRETVVVPEDFAFPIPDGMSYEEAAMLEPLSVAIWSVRRAAVQPGASVAVIGAGTIGCLTVQMAKVAGATTIIATDIEPFRLALAEKLGATHIVNAREENVPQRIAQITGAGVDVAFETCGSLATLKDTLNVVKPGGTAVLVGLPPEPEVPIPITAACSKEIDIKGIFRYAHTWPTAIALASGKRVDLNAMVTHRFPFEQIKDALDFAVTAKSEAMKVMITF